MFICLFILTAPQHRQENTTLFQCLYLNQVRIVFSAPFKIISPYFFHWFYLHAPSFISFLTSSGYFCLLFDHLPTIYNPLIQLCPPSYKSPFHFHSFLPLLQCHALEKTDHTRKIELVRYLMSSYVNGKVLDRLSEHANALASSAVASLEDEADQLSHFPFLPLPSDLVLTVPRHHGWYSRRLRS